MKTLGYDIEIKAFVTSLGMKPSDCRRLLVVGCGGEEEMVAFTPFFRSALVVGVDIMEFRGVKRHDVRLLRTDARQLPFPDRLFDCVYSYHALEHIPHPELAVAEIARVLHPKGEFFCGTPNRHRLLGYVGGRATRWEKIRWNLQDYARRLEGRFHNKYGAHAGFTRRELKALLTRRFAVVEDASWTYFTTKYPGYITALRWLYRMRLDEIVLPSIYLHAHLPTPERARHGVDHQLQNNMT